MFRWNARRFKSLSVKECAGDGGATPGVGLSAAAVVADLRPKRHDGDRKGVLKRGSDTAFASTILPSWRLRGMNKCPRQNFSLGKA